MSTRSERSLARGGPVPKRRRRGRGYTIIELASVLVLIALIAGSVSASIAGARRRVELWQVIAQLEHLDWRMREAARRFGVPAVLRVDRASGELEVSLAVGAGPESSFRYRVPRPCAITNFMAVGGAALQPAATSHRRARHEIACSPLGETPTYTLTICGAGGDSSTLVVAGVSGQATRMEESTDGEALLAALRRVHTR